MAIEKRMCAFHPDRLAIGICVETKVPICGECSTRYEGVNYSKEGLRRLQERRAAKTRPTGGNDWFSRNIGSIFFTLCAAICVWFTYLGYFYLFIGITDFLYPDTSTVFDLKKLLSELN